MATPFWPALARSMANHAEQSMCQTRRGALPIEIATGMSAVVAVFGNDGYAADARVKQEVELVRHCLDEALIQELAFGLSEDGSSWALVVEADNPLCHTPRGISSWVRLVTAFLDEAVWVSWRSANGIPTESAFQLTWRKDQACGLSAEELLGTGFSLHVTHGKAGTTRSSCR